MFMLCACSSTQTPSSIIAKSFCFKDSYYRNIKLTFNENHSYSLVNETTMSLAFSSFGTWKEIDKNMLLLQSNVLNASDSMLGNAPLTGQKIDLEKASIDKSYIFPVITSDTFYIKSNSYQLKGYVFGRCN